jgi:hypothetical protein
MIFAEKISVSIIEPNINLKMQYVKKIGYCD